MQWDQIFINAAAAAVGLETVVFALAAIGLNIHFGYTGLLNFCLLYTSPSPRDRS